MDRNELINHQTGVISRLTLELAAETQRADMLLEQGKLAAAQVQAEQQRYEALAQELAAAKAQQGGGELPQDEIDAVADLRRAIMESATDEWILGFVRQYPFAQRAASVHDVGMQDAIGIRLRRVAKAAGVEVEGDNAFYYGCAFSILGNIAGALERAASVPAQAVAASEDFLSALEKQVMRLNEWRLCMSHNDSYFGEPKGLVKSCTEQMEFLFRNRSRRETAVPAASVPPDSVECDHLIELAGALEVEKVRHVIEQLRAIRFREGPFQAGYETAIDELEVRLGFAETKQAELIVQPDTGRDAAPANFDAWYHRKTHMSREHAQIAFGAGVASVQSATVMLDGHQLRMALDLINPDGLDDRDQMDNELTFGVRQHRDDDGTVSTGMCCWNDDTDGVLPLDGEYEATPAVRPDIGRDAALVAKGRAAGIEACAHVVKSGDAAEFNALLKEALATQAAPEVAALSELATTQRQVVELQSQLNAALLQLKTSPPEVASVPDAGDVPVYWSVTYQGEHTANAFPTKDLAQATLESLNAAHPGEPREIVPLYTRPQPAPAVLTDAGIPASPDPVVETNVSLLRQRSAVGTEKYKTTLADSGLPVRALLVHALEESLDMANYIQAVIQQTDALAAAGKG